MKKEDLNRKLQSRCRETGKEELYIYIYIYSSKSESRAFGAQPKELFFRVYLF